MVPVCGSSLIPMVSDRTIAATPPAFAAATAPPDRCRAAPPYAWNVSISVGSIDPLKKTMRPRALSPRESSSWNERTSTTGAVIPSAGVPMLLPMARTFTGMVPASRETICPSSPSPRTQRLTMVGSRCTFSKPSARMCTAIAATAASACGDPVSRGPTDSSFARVAYAPCSRRPFCEMLAATWSYRPWSDWPASDTAQRTAAAADTDTNPDHPNRVFVGISCNYSERVEDRSRPHFGRLR